MTCPIWSHQSARSLQGRTASLRRKLKECASLAYVDAPILVPPLATNDDCGEPGRDRHAPPVPRHAWLVERLSGTMPVNRHAICEDTESERGKQDEQCMHTQVSRMMHFRPTYGWDKIVWAEKADKTCIALHQHKLQAAGFSVSLEYLRHVFATQGPFDGVMGFSQVVPVLSVRWCGLYKGLNCSFDTAGGCYCVCSLWSQRGIKVVRRDQVPVCHSVFRFRITCGRPQKPLPPGIRARCGEAWDPGLFLTVMRPMCDLFPEAQHTFSSHI